MEYVTLSAHKRYRFASVKSLDSGKRTEARVENGPGAIHRFLEKFERGSPVAVEKVGN